jgi:DNA-binding NarL/FixJ family response regulator
MPKTKVLLAEDHVVVAQGLAELLKGAFDLVGIVHDGRSLLDAADRLRPDVIVTDISMPLLNGLDAIRQIRATRPEIKIVVLTMHTDTAMAVSAFRAGARGYILKVSPQEEFIDAIGHVARGLPYVSPLVTSDLMDVLIEAARPAGSEGPKLTPRQREVLQLIAEGRTMKEVASILNISPRTAESHKYEIMQALGVDTTAALVQYAVRTKVVG